MQQRFNNVNDCMNFVTFLYDGPQNGRVSPNNPDNVLHFQCENKQKKPQQQHKLYTFIGYKLRLKLGNDSTTHNTFN